jgi:integrase
MQITSEGPAKITKATIDGAWRRRRPDHRLVVRDRDCRGLALVVNATAMRWEYAYRPRGTDPTTGRRWPNRTVTIGNPETHSADDARIEANRIKGQAASGADPAAERKAKAESERRNRSATLQRLVDDYTKALPKRPKMRGAGLPSPEYVADEITQVRLALADMEAETLPAANLTAQNVRQLLDRAEGAAAPRARFGALNRFCDWLQDAGHIQVNPCTQIARSRRPRAPQARAHYLTPPELAHLWRAAEGLGEPVWRDLARFLIAVPCRRGEAARMEWSHVDLDRAEWRQPSHMTKNRDLHRLHLHPLALDVLRARRQAVAEAETGGDAAKLSRILAVGQPRSGLVFPAPVSGSVVDTFSDLKASLTEATQPKDGEQGAILDGWTWHDFRRSFATALGEAGIPEAVADAVLNHRQAATRGGVLGVYQRSSRWPEQVKAMQFWGRLLSAAIEGRQAGTDVVLLHTKAG